MKLIVVDTETTGFDPTAGAALLEVAFVCVQKTDEVWEDLFSDSTFVLYDGDIPPEARAVHHISPKDVSEGSGAVPRDLAIAMLNFAEDGEYYVAHNAPFDMKFLPEMCGEDHRWIDTLQCARHLIPDAPGYSNQVLRYYLGLEPDESLTKGLAAHRALYDTAVTAKLLIYLLSLAPPEELYRLSTTPVLQMICKFGKAHSGKPWSEVPKSYLRWMLQDSDLKNDPKGNMDLLYTAEYWYRN